MYYDLASFGFRQVACMSRPRFFGKKRQARCAANLKTSQRNSPWSEPVRQIGQARGLLSGMDTSMSREEDRL